MNTSRVHHLERSYRKSKMPRRIREFVPALHSPLLIQFVVPSIEAAKTHTEVALRGTRFSNEIGYDE